MNYSDNETPTRTAMQNPAGDPTILVVDDETEIIELIEAFVPDEFDTRSATTKAEAIEKYGAGVDIAFLDRRLPDGSGDEILQKIRTSATDCNVAIVSAVSEEYNQQDVSYDEYISKPFTSDEIEQTARELVPGEAT